MRSRIDSCGDELTFVVETEGATGSAVYSLTMTAPADCFNTLEGAITVLSTDGTQKLVEGAPLVFGGRGVVSDTGFMVDAS